jgi:transposase
MPAKPSGEIKTRIVNNRQKNGDIYVLERKTIYDADIKNNKVLSTKLLSKIPKGSKNSVPTRPKKSKFTRSGNLCAEDTTGGGGIDARRERIGMMKIIDHLGTASGIDAALYANTNIGAAQKIISIARYLFSTNGQSLPGIQTWQYNHQIPYAEGLSENVYHDLFKEIGSDESLQQNFFASRCAGLGGSATVAYDSTTFSTYSENQVEARYGFNKTGDSLKTVKYLTLYSLETRQPIAFTKQPGNIPDVITVGNALSQLSVLGIENAELVTDNGYYSESNLADMFMSHFNFITLVKTSLKWVKSEIDAHVDELEKLSSSCPFDPSTQGITRILMRSFVKTRKYANKKTGMAKGDQETFRRKVYLHIYFNAARKAEENQAFNRSLISIKRLLEDGQALEELDEGAKKKVGKYLTIKVWGKTKHVNFNEKACAEGRRYHGYFAIVSSSEKDTFDALSKYRKREHIEDYFRSAKQNTDSARIRVWDADTLRGRMFAQFVALCYHEYLNEEVRKLKMTLGTDENLSSVQMKLEKKLKSWLENTPVYLQLQWFDAIEGVEISTALKTKRWSTEMTQRDALYMEKLGVVICV